MHYVGRFATTRAKLSTYLRRKLHERGWESTRDPDVPALIERLADLGYIDDAAFALSKARTLGQRGYGERRVDQALREAGISEDDGAPAKAIAVDDAVDSAIRYAQRRRIGPFASERPDPKGRDRALSAMIRAGHRFDLARRLVDLAPDGAADRENVAQTLES